MPAPTAGWSPDVQPWECPLTEAPQLDNFLLRPGKIAIRGPFQNLATVGPGFNCCGAIAGPSKFYLSSKVADATAIIDPWNAPLLRAASASLAAASLTGRGVGVTGSVGNFTFPSADAVPGPRSIDFGGTIYGISYDSAAAAVPDVSSSYFIKPLSLFKFNQTTEAFTVLTAAPHGSFDLIGYQSRIWMLGGIDPNGPGTHEPTALFFTNPITAGGGASAADWKDPVTLTTNKIVMDGDHADYAVGLATVRNGLVIFRRSSTYLLRGSTTANYVLTPISRDVGCLDARSIVETDQGVYFISRRGLMQTNGTTVVNVSGSVSHTLQTAITQARQSVVSGKPGFITCKVTSLGQIVVSIGVADATLGHYRAIFTAMYDPGAPVRGGAWVRITSPCFDGDSDQASGNLYAGQLYSRTTPYALVSVGDTYVTALERETQGHTFVDPSSSFSGLYDQTNGGLLAIPAVWKTGMPAITTASKRVVGQGKRYYIDYNFGAATNLVPTTGWSIQPVDASGAALDSQQSVPLGGATTTTSAFVSGVAIPPLTILRQNYDWWDEITHDVEWIVQWADPTTRSAQPTGTVAEIYGMGVEFQHSRELR